MNAGNKYWPVASTEFIGPRKRMLVRATPWELYHSSAICAKVVACDPVSGLKGSCGIYVHSLVFAHWFVLHGWCNRFWVGFVGVCEALCESDFLHLAVCCLCLVHVGRQALDLSALCCLWDGGASCLCSRVVLWDRMLDIQTSRWWNSACKHFLLNGSIPEPSLRLHSYVAMFNTFATYGKDQQELAYLFASVQLFKIDIVCWCHKLIDIWN